MKRREFITLLGGAATALPLAARAQTPPKMLRVGVVSLVNPRTTTFWVAFDRRMRELGYVEGQNLMLDTQDWRRRVQVLPSFLAAITHKATAEDVAFMKTFGSRIRARVGERREEYLAQPKAAA